MANQGLRPFVAIPQDLREWSRWCREQEISADDDSVATATIQDDAVTYAKLQNIVANNVFLGNDDGADSAVQELTAAEAATILEAVAWAFSAAVTFGGNIGFHGEAATGQQTTPSTISLGTISGSGADPGINANFADLQAAVNAIKTALDTKGLTG